jgi:FkbM family methyltransferase
MKKMEIISKDEWKNFIVGEARYDIPDECRGGICVDAGCNIGDFELNNTTRFDKYVCYDVFDKNIDECILNTSNLGIEIEIHKLAVWSESKRFINVYAYESASNNSIEHFGNSGNVGCIEIKFENGAGWKGENIIDSVETISIDSIIEKYGTINLLKIDVEGSEYEFLLGKDLSKINYIVGEIHFEADKQKELMDWISNTHESLGGFKFKLKGL